MLASLLLLHSRDTLNKSIHCANSQYTFCTKHSITTVLLRYAILYKKWHEQSHILILMFLFLKILYNKILYILY